METIFSTKQRVTILRSVIFDTEALRVNNIASRLKLSKGLVSKYFEMLLKKGVLKKSQKKYYVKESSITRGLRILLNLDMINGRLFREKYVKSAGLYGSCAKGTNTWDSDVDLWVRVEDDIEREKLARFSAKVTKSIPKCKLLILNTEKIEKLKSNETLFYHSLVFGSIIVHGEEDGLHV